MNFFVLYNKINTPRIQKNRRGRKLGHSEHRSLWLYTFVYVPSVFFPSVDATYIILQNCDYPEYIFVIFSPNTTKDVSLFS
jgi:hypothetical protein